MVQKVERGDAAIRDAVDDALDPMVLAAPC
jgi:hypothetical protein